MRGARRSTMRASSTPIGSPSAPAPRAGSRIEDDAFYAVLADPAGLRGFAPPGARYAVFLNKVDRPMRVAIAQRLAQGLKERGVGEVLWGDVRRQDWTAVRRGART